MDLDLGAGGVHGSGSDFGDVSIDLLGNRFSSGSLGLAKGGQPAALADALHSATSDLEDQVGGIVEDAVDPGLLGLQGDVDEHGAAITGQVDRFELDVGSVDAVSSGGLKRLDRVENVDLHGFSAEGDRLSVGNQLVEGGLIVFGLFLGLSDFGSQGH